MKRFLAVLMLMSGLLVAGGANATNTAFTANCNSGGFVQQTINGYVGDTLTVTASGSCGLTIKPAT